MSSQPTHAMDLARLPTHLQATLAQAAALANTQGAQLWLVGGIVRDLLLADGFGSDVDLAVEGDALALAAALGALPGGRVVATHIAFGTATVELPAPGGGRLVIDLARARAERYPRPAALPEVRPAPIEEDLARRDYSINALAVELRAVGGALAPGRTLDPFGGRADLAARLLRLLHPASLRDDPTRILRGVRLAARLGLRLEPASQAQLEEARDAGYLSLLSAERVLDELCLALAEPRPDAVLRLADTWGITREILPGMHWSPELGERGERLAASGGAGLPEGPLVWAGLIAYDLGVDELRTLAARYPLPAQAANLLRQLPALRALAPSLASRPPNSAIERMLRPFAPEATAVLHYAEPAAAPAVAHYFQTLRHTRTLLDGNDLRRLGLAPGPALGRLLDELRAATLDGVVATREEAEMWIRARLTTPGVA
ncbi:MAG: CCA tRNA nucleotidyltransferase [Chloroflexi bacterium OHK40]